LAKIFKVNFSQRRKVAKKAEIGIIFLCAFALARDFFWLGCGCAKASVVNFLFFGGSHDLVILLPNPLAGSDAELSKHNVCHVGIC